MDDDASDERDQIRRPGYYIWKSPGTIDASVSSRPFNLESIVEFEKFTRIARDFQPIIRALNVTELSYNELKRAIDNSAEYLVKIRKSAFSGLSILYDAQVDLLQKVMSYLSNARSFLDHTEARINRRFGERSDIYKSYKSKTNNIHKDKFSYRFLYDLRNASQHITLPISILNFDVKVQSSTDSWDTKAGLIISKSYILGEWSKWSKHLRLDLADLPENFDLIPLIDENIESLREICREVFLSKKVEILDCLHYLSAFLRVIRAPEGAVPVLWIGESTVSGSPPSNMIIPPFEDLRRIVSVLGWAS